LINFYGIINENAAKHTKLTDDDVKLLLDGIWNGTKNLISRSKVGQVPRLLIKVNYKENNYHIGDLNSMISLVKEISDEELRDISQVKINLTKIIDVLKNKKDLIQNVEYQIDDRARFELEGKEITINEALKTTGIPALQLSL
jgi:CRISPR-associated protein Csh2